MSNAKSRPEELKEIYVSLIDEHLDDLINNRAGEMHEIEKFADLMFIHPTHLSNTIKEVTGISACGIYQDKIMNAAQKLLSEPDRSIKAIAFTLSFEPSQFSKWFKKHNGVSPKQFRASIIKD